MGEDSFSREANWLPSEDEFELGLKDNPTDYNQLRYKWLFTPDRR